MSSKSFKFGATLAVAILALTLAIPAGATMQAETDSATAPGFDRSMESSSLAMTAPPSEKTEVAKALPAGPAMGSPAPIPAAAAAIVPIRNARSISEPRPEIPKKTFISLSLLNHSAVAFDSWSTRRLVDAGGSELNPVLRPVADSNALYAVMQIWPTAMDYIGAKMARSRKPWVRKMWWVPQTATAASSFVIGARNVSLANSSTR